MFDGRDEVIVDVPVSAGENVMVPVVRAIVRNVADNEQIILQRRDEPNESVAGKFEIPGGRWQAGEAPDDAIAREVEEETGLSVVAVHGIEHEQIDDRRAIAVIRPLAVAAGVDGAFPAAHVIVVVDAEGEPRPEPGETADVRWWNVDDVRAALDANADGFIPSTRVALGVYLGRS